MPAVGDTFTFDDLRNETGCKRYADTFEWAQANGKILKPTDTGYIVSDPVPLTDEQQAIIVRAKRDALLAETDYLLMSDYPVSEETLEAVKAYRQALRDVPEQSGFPQSVTYPTKPEGI